MDTSEFYIRQLLIRAAAVGERIAIYSHQPTRWAALTQPNIAVAERRRAPEFVPTITVNDRPTAISAAGLSSTVITLGRPESGLPPDLLFRQTSDRTSADDGHTNPLIWVLSCGNAELPILGRVTTRAAQLA